MALQDYDIEVKYAQNSKMALGKGLANCHHCDEDEQSDLISHPTTTPLLPSHHRYYEENDCQDLPKAYVYGCSFHHESQLRAGVGIAWVGYNCSNPNLYQLGPKTSQYAEIAAKLIALQQAVKLAIAQLVICSDSNYARHSFISHFPLWKEKGMKNARNKDVKLFLTCDQLVTDKRLPVYWKKIKGHSQMDGQDKDGHDEADCLAELGAEQGTPWELQNDGLQIPQTCWLTPSPDSRQGRDKRTPSTEIRPCK